MKKTRRMMRFLKKKRINKKLKLYKMAFGVAFDWTISIYCGLFAMFFLIIGFDMLRQMTTVFANVETTIDPMLPLVLIGVTLSRLAMAFQHAGIKITSAEWKLTALPFSIKDIWYITFKGIIRNHFILLLIFLSLLALTPFSSLFLVKWFCAIFLVLVLTIIPQWRLFQLSSFKKMSVYGLTVVLFGLFGMTYVLLDVHLPFSMLFILLMACVNIWLWPKRIESANWPQVIEKSDEKEWNMFFVQKMSGMDQLAGKPTKNYIISTILTSRMNRSPFPYAKPDRLLRKLWRKTILTQLKVVMYMLGCILSAMIVLSLEYDILQGIGVMLSVFIFIQTMLSLFGLIFTDKLFHSIPWRLDIIKEAFIQTTLVIGVVVFGMITLILLVTNDVNLLLMGQLLFIYLATLFLFKQMLNINIQKLHNKWHHTPVMNRMWQLITFVILALSMAYPVIILVWCLGMVTNYIISIFNQQQLTS
ncbi:hypothetical protein MUN88_03160 [Gracilibacillus caseinilyticus]|uniref:ABC-2 type transport system permease protein n=1 Tax=Gracilibacillus caseinilyticus TaxID=2932256 RepID=A0ABY4EXY1_9BACI|nr:hypothetical protein [Gracilibacillus caseinilyticus]UOQ49140.1 hypothetical protein MUN88_03160 [Gracilibacillus caseinilyticus]